MFELSEKIFFFFFGGHVFLL